MKAGAWFSGLAVAALLAASLAGCTPVAPPPGAAGSAGAAQASAAAAGVPVVAPPGYLPPGETADEALRAQLIALRGQLCQDMELASSMILNTGVLGEFPAKIQAAADIGIPALEAQLQVCSPGDDASKSTGELMNDVSRAEWLLKLHLTALESATLEKPQLRPIDAEGSFADFLTLHDVLMVEMRAGLQRLTDGDPTLEDAQALGAFWTGVLAPHAQAEDAALFDLARGAGDATLARSADLIEREHGPIEAGIARYMEALGVFEAGETDAEALIAAAREVRARTELHFGREEATVIRPLQALVADEAFRPAVDAQEEAVGAWLRAHGWEGSSE